MTTKDPGIDHGTLPTGGPFILDRWTRRLYTAMPGEVVAYDAATRRAGVRGALALVMSNGTQVERPVVSNVPVVFQQSGNFLMDFDLSAGDAVLLVYSMRGLSRWKLAHGMSTPDVDGMMSERDAFCIPGLGPAGLHQPDVRIHAAADSLTIQRNDGIRVVLDDSGVSVESSGVIAITSTGNITINGGNVTVNGVRVANAPVGTDSAAGPGSHSHGLTGA